MAEMLTRAGYMGGRDYTTSNMDLLPRLSTVYPMPAPAPAPAPAAPPAAAPVAPAPNLPPTSLSSLYGGQAMAAPTLADPTQRVTAPAPTPAPAPAPTSSAAPTTRVMDPAAIAARIGATSVPWANPNGLTAPGGGMSPAQTALLHEQARKAAMQRAYAGQQQAVQLPTQAQGLPALGQPSGVR